MLAEDPKALEERIRNGMRLGYTKAFAEKTQAERRAWMLEMFLAGMPHDQIAAETGLTNAGILSARYRLQYAGRLPSRPKRAPPGQAGRRVADLPPEDVKCSETQIQLDTGAYMAAVRRLNVAPPESWRFGRDLSVLPARPLSHSPVSCSTGWCADQGEYEREYHG